MEIYKITFIKVDFLLKFAPDNWYILSFLPYLNYKCKQKTGEILSVKNNFFGSPDKKQYVLESFIH